ncbi:MAG TPA: thioredoxin family protein [Bacteroidota bacterium]|nr:thioredoxin family protein [Bacteroidota bacterium]
MTVTCRALRTVFLCALVSGCSSKADLYRGDPPERGWVSRDIFQTPGYSAFKAGYDSATVAPQFTQMIGQLKQGIEVTVFFGAWCSDSKRQVPRFLRIADGAQMDPAHIHFYALDRTKKSSDGLTERFAIDRVPTFIFIKDGKEVGRITEEPKNTLEADMLTILAEAQRR